MSLVSSILLNRAARAVGGLLVLAGLICLVLTPAISETVFTRLWTVEPLAFIAGLLMLAGLGGLSISYLIGSVQGGRGPWDSVGQRCTPTWSEVTQDYFELFHHDLGRPLRRILGKERELRTALRFSESKVDSAVMQLLDDIECQVPDFRLMMSNIQVLIQLEAPDSSEPPEAVEPKELVRKIVDGYDTLAADSQKEIAWWSEPQEFGIVYSHGSAIDHIVTNLVDNALRFAMSLAQIKVTRNPSHFFVRVQDDGRGIQPQYIPHIFDRGWTPEVARREEKIGSGLGLFIVRTLARRYGGDVTVETVADPEAGHHTTFLLSLPLGKR